MLFDGQRIKPHRWLFFCRRIWRNLNGQRVRRKGVLAVPLHGFGKRRAGGAGLFGHHQMPRNRQCSWHRDVLPLARHPHYGQLESGHMAPPCPFSDWGMAIGIGALSLVAQVSMTKALHLEDAARVMPFKYFGAILALGMANLVFGEVVSGWALVGIVIVLAAVTANTLSGNREKRKALSAQ